MPSQEPFRNVTDDALLVGVTVTFGEAVVVLGDGVAVIVTVGNAVVTVG